jgi:DNA-binding transcriptional ArsR family regulator
MSGKKKSKRIDYEDFITSKPDTILFVRDDQMALIDEHVEIIVALIGKNLTVKEIHRLYLEDAEGPTYSKTLKTVYRHLDALEEASLVRVAGHRKYEGSRQTEKLFCRTARIYFQEDTKDSKWESKEGQQQLRQLGKLIVGFFKIPPGRSKKIQDLLERYYDAWSQIVRKLFQETSEDEMLADIFGDVGIGEIKEQSRMVGMIGVMLEHPDLLTEFQKILSS